MYKNIAISSSLHMMLIFIATLSLPFLIKKPIDLPPIISVELIQITDQTNIPFAPKAKKIIEKVKKKTRKISFRAGSTKESKKRKTRCCSSSRSKK